MLRPALISLSIAAVAAAVAFWPRARPGDARYRERTPPERVGARAIASHAKADLATRVQVDRLRPVLAAWGRALERGDEVRASRAFALPAVVALGQTVEYHTRAEVRAFNAALPCGARLLGVGRAGRYVIATFRLTRRPDHVCDGPGKRVRIAVLARGSKIWEWRQVPDTPAGVAELRTEATGPARPARLVLVA